MRKRQVKLEGSTDCSWEDIYFTQLLARVQCQIQGHLAAVFLENRSTARQGVLWRLLSKRNSPCIRLWIPSPVSSLNLMGNMMGRSTPLLEYYLFAQGSVIFNNRPEEGVHPIRCVLSFGWMSSDTFSFPSTSARQNFRFCWNTLWLGTYVAYPSRHSMAI